MVRRFNLYFRSCFGLFLSVEILTMFAFRRSLAISSLGVTCILSELAFAMIASYVSPGYVVDMKDEEDVENASLLNTNAGSQLHPVTTCKQCGVRRPLRSLHCTEYTTPPYTDLGVISVSFVSTTTMFSLTIALAMETSIITCSSSCLASSHASRISPSGRELCRLFGSSL